MLFTLIAVSKVDYINALAVGVILLISALATLLTALILKRVKVVAFTVALLVMCGLSVGTYSLSQHISATSVAGLDGNCGYVSGTVVQTSDSYGKYIYIVKVNGQNKYKLMLTSSEDLGGKLYDHFSGYVTFRGGTSAIYGSDIEGFANSAQFTSTQRVGIASVIKYLRSSTADCIDRFVGGDAGALIKGVVMGDISDMSDETRNAFRAVGLSHTIVVSGAHLSVAMSLLMLFLTISPRRRFNSLIILVAMLLYMALAGFGSSVIRAGICSVVFLFSRTVARNQNSMNSLGITAIIMCLLLPSTVASVGFQLSFLSTAGIVIICPAFGRYLITVRIPRLLKKLVMVAVLSLSAQVMSLPIALLHFGTVTPLSLLANLFLSWLMSFILMLGLVLVISAPIIIFRPIAVVAAWLAGGAASICVYTAQKLAGLPYAQIAVSKVEVLFFIGLLAIAVAARLFVRRRSLKRIFTATICATLVACVAVCVLNTYRVSVVTVSKGCAVVSYRGSTAVIGGCDSDYEQDLLAQAIASLNANSVELLDAHHCEAEAIAATVGKCSPKRVIVPNDQSRSTEGVVKLKDGVTTTLESGMKIEVYNHYTVITAGDIRFAISEGNVDLREAGRFDYILCRGKTIAEADGWIMHKGANALAIDGKRVYNSNTDRFSLKIDRYLGVISQ